MAGDAFDPAQSFVYLKDDGTCEPLAAGTAFWSDLAAGRIDTNSGFLMMAGEVTDDMKHREIHPEGEEILLRQPGWFDVVIDAGEGKTRTVRLDATTPCTIMPRGHWHRFVMIEPGRVLFVTYGRGTQHRPL